ncbi:acyltransferase family protein [Olleya aquimaris]|uniref:Peptidoglycan/LPS O-acetylase OafA/YrhL n=1 Tax=Olleya aquimaris TaxID=639310 RepID=A0A327RD92_9FLAO|nr:acyltransferase [Olleya aquimaris]RAJ11847.1 peptidoglycan/LPS O-acetylase OafA/YrhL [Olleya aquimaris]
MNRLPNLDVLRFLLASLVVFFHLPQLCRNQGLPYFLEAPIFNRGIEAVYMFFVLSGFLIIKIIYSDKQRDAFSIKKFYIRRVLRIFPLYYLIVVFGFLFYWVILPKIGIPFDNNYNLIDGVLLSVFFLPNVLSELFKPGGILEVLWSIGIEEQFYIIVAPLLFLMPKRSILQFLVLITATYFIIYHLEPFDNLRRFIMVFFFLFFGGIIAVLEEKKKLEFLKRSKLVPLVIVLSTVLYFTTSIFEFETLAFFNLFTMVLFGLFIHTIAHNNFGVEIRSKALNYLGQISYGIYMFHVIALNAVVFLFLKLQKQELFNDIITIILIYLLTFAITIIMAHVSFKYYETYFLKLKNKFRE